MTSFDAIVFVVDDDPLIRDALEQLIKSVGLKAYTFSSAREFLEEDLPDGPCCLISDIRMPGLSGLDLQDELAKKALTIPVIFITGHGTVPMSVRAMKAGAVDFIQKPFEDQALLDAIHSALERNRQTRMQQTEIREIKRQVDSLTPREYEVLLLVTSGKPNKQIAYELKLSENTIKTHRAHIMQKMKTESLADLVRLTEKVNMSSQRMTSGKLKDDRA